MAEDTIDEILPLQRFLRSYQKSEIIFEEGSSGNEMYLIHSGKVLLSVRKDKGEEAVLAILNPGDFLVRWP